MKTSPEKNPHCIKQNIYESNGNNNFYFEYRTDRKRSLMNLINQGLMGRKKIEQVQIVGDCCHFSEIFQYINDWSM